MSTDGSRAAGGDRSKKISGDSGYVADYTPPNAVPMVDQATIDYFLSKDPKLPFKDPVGYYKWIFGDGGVVPSTDPAQDKSQYFAPASGDLTKIINQPLNFDMKKGVLQGGADGAWAIPLAIATMGAGLEATAPASATSEVGVNGLAEGADFSAGMDGAGATVGDAAATGGGLINSATPAATQVASTVAPAAAEVAQGAAAGVAPGVDTAINVGGLDGALGDTAANYAAGMGSSNAFTGPATSSFLDSAMQWAKDNPMLSSTGLNLAGGLIKGAMTPTPEEQAKALADAKVQAETAIAAAKRANNNLSAINTNRLKPSGVPLVRPGIINSNARMP